MFTNFILVQVNVNYCDYLRKFDNRVVYNKDKKELRPFIGVLFKVKDFEYFAPLLSPKKKHKTMKNNIDFIKIDKGNLGVVNFNNMIPVCKNNYKLVNLDEIPTETKDKKYYYLLQEQRKYLNAYYAMIVNKAYKLYDLYTDDRLCVNIKKRCCNFKLLEEKCLEYNCQSFQN